MDREIFFPANHGLDGGLPNLSATRADSLSRPLKAAVVSASAYSLQVEMLVAQPPMKKMT